MQPSLNAALPVDAGLAMRSAYTDLSGLKSIDTESEDGARAAARQFESLFINLWLKGMRDANRHLSDGGLFSSSELDLHQEMLDHQWSVHMAESGGLGLADLVVDQLQGRLTLRDGAGTFVGFSGTGRPHAPASGVETQAAPREAAREAPRGGYRASLFASPGAFVDELLPDVSEIAGGAGMPVLAVLGQAALETGWGSRVIHREDGVPSNNLFGLKADRSGPEPVEVETREYTNGRWVTVREAFRAYGSVADALRDYVDFLTGSSRYSRVANAQDPADFADELQRAGYATDPGYASKLKAVMTKIRELAGTTWRP